MPTLENEITISSITSTAPGRWTVSNYNWSVEFDCIDAAFDYGYCQDTANIYCILLSSEFVPQQSHISLMLKMLSKHYKLKNLPEMLPIVQAIWLAIENNTIDHYQPAFIRLKNIVHSFLLQYGAIN